MKNYNPQSKTPPTTLVTDLDGTLIPLHGSRENEEDLVMIKSALSNDQFKIIFATGRQFASVTNAIDEYKLPIPEYIICDVGTSIYQLRNNKFDLNKDYQAHLAELTANQSRSEIFKQVSKLPKITPQEEAHQQEFKISFLCKTQDTEDCVEVINQWLTENNYKYFCMGSIDPFENCGMLDLLPCNTSKAYATEWLADFIELDKKSIVYAGDSGNDYAALTYGFHSILVQNASAGLAEKVQKKLDEKNLSHQFYHAKKKATSGVLEGCKHYQLIS